MTTDELAKMSDEELTGDQRAWLAMDDDALLHQYSGAVQWRARGYEEKDTGHNFIHTELLRRLSRQVPQSGVHVYRDGVEVKVLGTLPFTADGCVLGDSATVWWRDIFRNGEVRREMTTTLHGICHSSADEECQTYTHAHQPARVLYSTREAATLAKQTADRAGKEGENGQ